MSIPGERAEIVSGFDYSKLNNLAFVNSLLIETEEVEANGEVDFLASEDEDMVKSVDLTPEDANLPQSGRIVMVKVDILQGGSTDSDAYLYQSDERRGIDEVISITELSEGDTPSSFILGGGLGIPFINRGVEDNQMYFTLSENSGISSEYNIEVDWFNIN